MIQYIFFSNQVLNVVDVFAFINHKMCLKFICSNYFYFMSDVQSE